MATFGAAPRDPKPRSPGNRGCLERPASVAGSLRNVATVLFFAQAREATGTKTAEVDGDCVGAVLDAALVRFGAPLERILPHCKVWVNGDPADRSTLVVSTDEVALLPPVSGG